MPDLNLVPIFIATAVTFVLGGFYYAILADQLASVSEAAAAEQPARPWQLGAELLRCIVLVVVVAGIASAVGTDRWQEGLWLGLALWVGFPLVLWTGAMVHERTPLKLAAIHGGDWLFKLPVIAIIVSVWR